MNAQTVILSFIAGIILIIGGIALFGVFSYRNAEEVSEPVRSVYTNEAYGFQFAYPGTYFIAVEGTTSEDRNVHTVVLALDTPDIRQLFNNPETPTEGPPAITVSVYENTGYHDTERSFIENVPASNFALSDGLITATPIGGEEALRYRATGLYENINVVVARDAYVYMFTVFYGESEDPIVDDFEMILQTLEFTTPPTTSAPPSILPYESGVEGTVVLSCTPEAEISCSEGQYETTIQIIRPGSPMSAPFTTASSDSSGNFSVTLPPGSYALQPIAEEGLACETLDVEVPPDSMIQATLTCFQ